jgi:hypothetical protein
VQPNIARFAGVSARFTSIPSAAHRARIVDGCLLAGTPVALVNPTSPADLIERMLAPLGQLFGRRARDVLR